MKKRAFCLLLILIVLLDCMKIILNTSDGLIVPKTYIIETVASYSRWGEGILVNELKPYSIESACVSRSGVMFFVAAYAVKKLDLKTGRVHNVAGVNALFDSRIPKSEVALEQVITPTKIVCKDDDSVLISQNGNGISLISQILPNGRIKTIFNGLSPYFITTDKNGATVFSASAQNVIGRVTGLSTYSVIAGQIGKPGSSGDGGPATSALVKNVYGLAYSSEGVLYFCDTLNWKIRMVDLNNIISTYAGVGTEGYSGDGGLAINANLKYPTDLVFDSRGDLIFSDSGNSVIRKIFKSNGTIITIAGTGKKENTGDGGLATEASFTSPYYLSITSDDEIIITFQDVHLFRKIDKYGIISTIAGCKNNCYKPLLDKYEQFIDFILDENANPIYITTSSIDFVDGVTSDITSFLDPNIIETTKTITSFTRYNNSFYVGVKLPFTSILTKITPDRNASTYGGDRNELVGNNNLAIFATLLNARFLAVSPDGSFYFSQQTQNVIRKVGPDGVISVYSGKLKTFTESGIGGLASDASTASVVGLSVATNGDLYLLSVFQNGVIYKIENSTGLISYVTSPSVQLSKNVAGIYVSYNNDIYISDGSQIKQISGGTVRIIAGTGTPTDSGEGGNSLLAGLNTPRGITMNSNNELLFCDTGNHRIKKIDVNGNIKTIAGTGTSGFSGDGGLALNANLNAPDFIQISPNGQDFYFIDKKINCYLIRKVTSDGIITTIAGRSECNSKSGWSNDGVPALGAILNVPMGLGFLSGELIFQEQTRTRKIDNNGLLQTIAGGDGNGGPVIQATFNTGITRLKVHNNTLYIGDNTKIRKVNLNTGIITHCIGSGISSDEGDNVFNANFKSIRDFFITDEGEILIVDSSANKVRKLLTNGTVLTIAGNGNQPVSVNSSLAINSKLSSPSSVLQTKDGLVFISCSSSLSVINQTGYIYQISGQGKSFFAKQILASDLYSSYPLSLVESGDYIYFGDTSGVRKINRGCLNSVENSLDNNTCICKPGYYGEGCLLFDCFDVSSKNESACNGKGICIAPNKCQCSEIYAGEDCSSYGCFGKTVNDNTVCSGKGQCSFGKCICNNNYYGSECSEFYCFGVNSSNSNVCSGLGSCIDFNNCSCIDGYYGDACQNKTENTKPVTCFSIAHNESNVCSSHGQCLNFDECTCFERFYGDQCQYLNYSCNGILPQDKLVCSGKGECISDNNCSCFTLGNGMITGTNCEIVSCNKDYFGIDCSAFCDPEVTCSNHGKCLSNGNCECHYNSNQGFWKLNNCSQCEEGYYGSLCSIMIEQPLMISDNGKQINFKVYGVVHNLTELDCSSIIDSNHLLYLGISPVCMWSGAHDFSIILGNSSLLNIDSIGINILAFDKPTNNIQYVWTKVMPPINQTKPKAIVTATPQIVGACEDFNVIASNSYSIYGKVTFRWTILKSPPFYIPLTSNSSVLSFGVDLISGFYMVNLVVTDIYNNNDSIIIGFTKESNQPQLRVENNEIFLQYDRTPLYITKFISLVDCYNNSDVLSSNIQWSLIQGRVTIYSTLSTNDLLINEFPQEEQVCKFNVKLLDYDISTNVTIHLTVPDFVILLYQSKVNSTHATIQVGFDPSDVLSKINSPWKWSCVKAKDKSVCDSSVINSLEMYANSKSEEITISSSADIDLTLQIMNTFSNTTIIFPQIENAAPIINVLSISPKQSIIPSNAMLSIQTVVSLNGKIDVVDSEVTVTWLLNSKPIPPSYLSQTSSNNLNLYISNIADQNGYKNSLKMIATSKTSQLSSEFTYSFEIASNPKQCNCSCTPQSGTALETIYKISCPACVSLNTQLEIGYIDVKSGLHVPLISGKDTSLNTQLPYLGADNYFLYVKNIDQITGASSETNIPISVQVPYAASVADIKKKSSKWTGYYNTLQLGDPRKIVFSYSNIQNCVNAMLSNLLSRSSLVDSDLDLMSLMIQEMVERKDDPITESRFGIQLILINQVLSNLNSIDQVLARKLVLLLEEQLIRFVLNSNMQIPESLTKLFMTISDFFLRKSSMESVSGYSLQYYGLFLKIKLRNQVFSIPTLIETRDFHLRSTKIFPSDLVNRRISYGSENEWIAYPKTIIEQMDLRKWVNVKILTLFVNETTTLFQNSTTDTYSMRRANITLLSTIEDRQISTDISYSFKFERLVTGYNTTIEYLGNSIKTTNISSEVVCLSDSFCKIDILSKNLYTCTCSSTNVSFVSIGEKVFKRISYSSVSPSFSVSPPTIKETSLDYLAFISLVIIPCFGVCLVVACSLCLLKTRKKKDVVKSKEIELPSV